MGWTGTMTLSLCRRGKSPGGFPSADLPPFVIRPVWKLSESRVIMNVSMTFPLSRANMMLIVVLLFEQIRPTAAPDQHFFSALLFA